MVGVNEGWINRILANKNGMKKIIPGPTLPSLELNVREDNVSLIFSYRYSSSRFGLVRGGPFLVFVFLSYFFCQSK